VPDVTVRLLAQLTGRFGLLAIGVVLAAAVVEGTLATALCFPSGLAGVVLGAVKRVHLRAEWPLPQLDPRCARWDPELGCGDGECQPRDQRARSS